MSPLKLHLETIQRMLYACFSYGNTGPIDRDGHHHSSGSLGPSNSYGVPAPQNGHHGGPSAFGPAPSNAYGAPAASSGHHGLGGAPTHSYGVPAVVQHQTVHKKGSFVLSKFNKVNKKGHIGTGHYADSSNGGGYGGSSSSSGGNDGKYVKGGKKGHGKHHKYVHVGTYHDRPELKPNLAKFKVNGSDESPRKIYLRENQLF